MPLFSDSLQRRGPSGLWKAPLTEEQLDFAIAFGVESGDMEALNDTFAIDPGGKEIGAVVSVSTAFERIAMYAAFKTANNQRIEPSFITETNETLIFRTHYTLDFTSSHKLISVMRYQPNFDNVMKQHPGNFERMQLLDKHRLGDGLFRQVVGFPYPTELNGVEYYEVAVPKWFVLSKVSSHFTVHLDMFH